MASKGASALTGAGVGAAAGSVAGPIGTGIGAVVGGIGGYLLGDDDEGNAPSYNPDYNNFQYGVGRGIDANGQVVGETKEQRDAKFAEDMARLNARRQAALEGLEPGTPEYAEIEARANVDFENLEKSFNQRNHADPAVSDNVAAQRTRGLVSQQEGLAALGEQAYGREAPTQAMPGAITQAQSGGQAFLEGADAASKKQQQEALGGLQNQVTALNNFANGPEGPSAAQAQLQAGTDMAARQQYGMARSQPGGGGAALRGAAFNAAGISGNAANTAAMLRAQETNAFKQRQLEALNSAMGGAGTVAGATAQARGQDQGYAATQAGQANYDAGATNAFNQGQQQIEFNVGANNLNAAGQARGQNDAMTLGAIGGIQNLNNQIENVSNDFQGGNIAYENAKATGAGLASSNANAAADRSRQDLQMGLNAASQGAAAYASSQGSSGGGGGGGGGPVDANGNRLMMSDARAKDVERKERALASSLGALDTIGNAPGYSYRYKDPDGPGAAPGRQVSSMAQDLERGPRGREIVHNTPHGKMVDYDAVMKMTPGAITELNQKVSALERALGRAA